MSPLVKQRLRNWYELELEPVWSCNVVSITIDIHFHKGVSHMRNIKLLGLVGLLLIAQVGAAAQLQNLDGKPQQLSDYTGKGKWLIVMIWASDCLVCNKEASNYEDFYQQHRTNDATVLGVSVDGKANVADARHFVQEHKLTFPNVVGELEQVGVMVADLSGMQWVGTPTFLIYNPAGKLKVADSGAVPVQLIEKYIASHINE